MMIQNRMIRRLKFILPILFFLLLEGAVLAAASLPFTSVRMEGRMPVTEIFRVEQNEAALDFNLSASRNSIIRVGSYTLVSNNTISKFRLAIRPGEDGNQEYFAFTLDEGEPLLQGQASEIPFTVRVSSNISRAVSVAGQQAMEKDLGVRGVYGNNDAILYETGDILAEIPDFDPDLYATGWYSAAIQLSIEVI
ncbi:MAG: hypothetical protein AB7S66_00485 [Sphaerochaeta sp.]|uniref:hypothetical protein n=1 Tax=Sphaerochaeta sp. TaxID=1972642 RepID=UPI003D0E02E9